MIHHASVSSHHVDDDDDDTSWETDDQIIERIPGALRPPPYSALNRSWLREGGKSCAWAEVSVSTQYNSIQLNTTQYNWLQLNTTEYNSIQLIKLFWHLPLTIFAASPYQPPRHFLFSRQSMDTKTTEEKQWSREHGRCIGGNACNWQHFSILAAIWFNTGLSRNTVHGLL